MRVQPDTKRVVIENVRPQVDCGRFPVKRCLGERVTVEADIFADGHDALAGVLRHRHERDAEWIETELEALVNDRWRASFSAARLGIYFFTLAAWIDHFETWRRDLLKKVQAEQDVEVDLRIGAEWVREAAERATPAARAPLMDLADALESADLSLTEKNRLALSEEAGALMAAHPDRAGATQFDRQLAVVVDRERARVGAWYEFFPRSASPEPGRHGTFKDCQNFLPYVAAMGFDVVYLPPIHPIGRGFRKGRNNSPNPNPDDPGSPWAIGSEEGGHTAIHPALGTLEDFRALLAAARGHNLEIALDIAFQTSPDHPWAREHPEWFRRRPDGTIQYAENPPKKYEDIYPLNFESGQREALWEALKEVFLFWIGEGVRIFRVDNPHTKPFAFWEWVVGEIRRDWPEVIFLSEAFTRPRVMYRLAKVGFSQSYTYFAWRNTRREIEQYMTELTQGEVSEFFRPNLWPNTPDILTEYLQTGGAGGLCRATGAGGDAWGQLRHLRAGVRAVRGPDAPVGKRGIPGFGKVRDPPLGAGAGGLAGGADHAGQPHPARQPGPARQREPAFPYER